MWGIRFLLFVLLFFDWTPSGCWNIYRFWPIFLAISCKSFDYGGCMSVWHQLSLPKLWFHQLMSLSPSFIVMGILLSDLSAVLKQMYSVLFLLQFMTILHLELQHFKDSITVPNVCTHSSEVFLLIMTDPSSANLYMLISFLCSNSANMSSR